MRVTYSRLHNALFFKTYLVLFEQDLRCHTQPIFGCEGEKQRRSRRGPPCLVDAPPHRVRPWCNCTHLLSFGVLFQQDLCKCMGKGEHFGYLQWPGVWNILTFGYILLQPLHSRPPNFVQLWIRISWTWIYFYFFIVQLWKLTEASRSHPRRGSLRWQKASKAPSFDVRNGPSR